MEDKATSVLEPFWTILSTILLTHNQNKSQGKDSSVIGNNVKGKQRRTCQKVNIYKIQYKWGKGGHRNKGRSQSNILWNTENSIDISLHVLFYIQTQGIHNYWLKFVVMKITFFCDVRAWKTFTYILEEPIASI